MARRRNIAEFSLSFLDVICCGFGAVILLLMITKTVQPQIIEDSTVNLEGLLQNLQRQLFEMRGETTILNRDLNAKHEQLSKIEEKIAFLRGTLASVRSKHDTLNTESTANETITEQLALARQSLTEEMKRLMGTNYQPKNNLIGGIPVDSEYIVFIIDTSGSMRVNEPVWDRAISEFQNILNIYPEVKGMQILDANGNYLVQSYRGKWIKDSPGMRRSIIKKMEFWSSNSFSNPVPGIYTAIRTFYADDKNISLYVFGDDFQATGRQSISAVLDEIDRINIETENGKRRVRIHAVGFPVLFYGPQHTRGSAKRFAALMREMSYRNGGTFVALSEFE